MYKVNVDRKLNKLNAKELHTFHQNQVNHFLKEYKVAGKVYGHYTECGKLTNKYVAK